MTCTHKAPDVWVWEDVEVSPYGDTERQLVNIGGQYTYDESELGRFHCTQCGEVGYYTGLWKDFYEKGIPCPGSNFVDSYRKK